MNILFKGHFYASQVFKNCGVAWHLLTSGAYHSSRYMCNWVTRFIFTGDLFLQLLKEYGWEGRNWYFVPCEYVTVSNWQKKIYIYIYAFYLMFLYTVFTCLVYRLPLKPTRPAASLIHSIYGWGWMLVAKAVVSTREEPTGCAFEIIIYFIYMVPVSHTSLLWNMTEMKHS